MAASEEASRESAQGAGEQPPADFAETVERLEALVQQLESGALSLEGSLEAFEQGVRLANDAQRRLSEAELRVRTLTEGSNGGPVLAPFDPQDAGEFRGGGNNDC
ncbi:exodeoxyribonuclease VII small subunit [Halomonas halocynthiae]|uniref:exodeoxyribonuclease VII small subunit n=1 Tax=Halomonas halocynthiae TaxID=176290 RepID=UPI0003F63BEA|nr:exodeoxyribonuclease VII small subunit [Halomonas halocynthiae]